MPVNRFGGGARTNENGLRFEQETNLEEALKNVGYIVKDQGIVEDQQGNPVALSAPKHKLYSRVLKPLGINWKDRISKQLLPDEALLNYANKRIYIIEKKFQHDSGSVDEKLQTCAFKKRQYQKLFSGTEYDVVYLYVCNDWFSNPRYKDVHEYIYSAGCHIFFNELPLDFLDLPLA